MHIFIYSVWFSGNKSVLHYILKSILI